MITTTEGRFGVDCSAGRLRRVALRRPAALLTADHKRWHYTKALNPTKVVDQYEMFVALIEASGAEIDWLADTAPDGTVDGLADSVFTYDPSFVVPAGAVVLRPGKELRVDEADLHAKFYEAHTIPVIGRIDAPGMVEGGDCFWLDGRTIAVGRGFRTNQAGIEQFAEILRPHGI
ncbi:MAG: arginine deiminase family protein, partial [Acidimicrobiales bacterium]